MLFFKDLLQIIYIYKIKFNKSKDKCKLTEELIQDYNGLGNKKKI